MAEGTDFPLAAGAGQLVQSGCLLKGSSLSSFFAASRRGRKTKEQITYVVCDTVVEGVHFPAQVSIVKALEADIDVK